MPEVEDAGMNMPDPSKVNPAEAMTSLPTRRLILASILGGLAVGDIWALAALVGGYGRVEAVAGLLAGAAAAAAGVAAVLIIGPWKMRPLIRWPFVFLAATFAQVAVTLALGLLIYFRSQFGTVGMWLCLVLSAWAVLFAMVRVYASHMRQFSPAPGGPGGADSASME
ncbi:MAG: hypothetical protein JSV91_09255 [Phycisphaerales bacterium]|nr:MAG: hypothetical protein JSV91_09255 [Phycisphaerales bacterium]